jgi:hypothetical protein
VEELIAQISGQMRWIVARCIEEALRGEVMSLLGGSRTNGVNLRGKRQRHNAIDVVRGIHRTFGEMDITPGIWTRVGDS